MFIKTVYISGEHIQSNDNQIWCVNLGEYMYLGSVAGSDYDIYEACYDRDRGWATRKKKKKMTPSIVTSPNCTPGVQIILCTPPPASKH